MVKTYLFVWYATCTPYCLIRGTLLRLLATPADVGKTEFCTLSCAPVANLRVGASLSATFPPFRGNGQTKLHASPTARDSRGQQDEKGKTPTNRATGAPCATASSACPALSLAADAVSFHARQTVAANLFGHVEEIILTAEMGSHTRQVGISTNVWATTGNISFSDFDRTASGTVAWLAKVYILRRTFARVLLRVLKTSNIIQYITRRSKPI